MIGCFTKARANLLYQPNALFEHDGFQHEDDQFRVVFEGICLDELSSRDLISGFTAEPLPFTHRLHGHYAFCVWNKQTNTLTVGNDLLSKQSLFYYYQEGFFAFATTFFDMVSLLKAENRTLTLNEKALEHMCEEGVFATHETYYKEVHFLLPYHSLQFDVDKLQFSLQKQQQPPLQKRVSSKQAVAKLDQLFREGCRLQVEKNQKNGYRQYLTLSSGMDSRMVFSYVMDILKDSGQDPSSVTLLTYAEKGSLDDTVSQAISEDYGCPRHFEDLSGGAFMMNRENILKQNEGQMYYAGSTGAYNALKAYSKQQMGLVHTGIGGGEIMGDIIHPEGDTARGSYYPLLNQEINIMDLRTCLNFEKTTSCFCKAVSPFLYEDFFEYVLTLPASLKRRRKLYSRWYLQASKINYPTTYFYGKVTEKSSFLSLLNRRIKNLFKKFTGRKDRFDMNPFFYWYKHHPELRSYLSATYEQDKQKLKGHVSAKMLDAFDHAFAKDVFYKLRVLTASGTLCILQELPPFDWDKHSSTFI